MKIFFARTSISALFVSSFLFGGLVQAQESSTTSIPLTSTPASNLPLPQENFWSFSLANETTMAASNLHYASAAKSYGAVNFAGLQYKPNGIHTFSLRQYFTVNHDGPKGSDTTTLDDTVFLYARNGLSGIFNSNPLDLSFRYYVPTSQASRRINSLGTLRMDLEAAWTLNPKWKLSYYFNPAQTFVSDTQSVDEEGAPTAVSATTTLSHYGNVYYSFNDDVNAYTYAGLSHKWKTSPGTLSDEETILGVGANFNFIGGRLTVNPEIAVASPRVAKAARVPAEKIIQEKNLSYILTSQIVF